MRRVCLLGCKYVLEGWKWKECMPQCGPAMHGMILAVRTSGAMLALSKGSVTLSPPPVDARERHGHGVTHPQRTQPLGFGALGCHETAVVPLHVDAQGEGSSSVNLSQLLLDPTIFLAGWLQGITSIRAGFDSTCALRPLCPHPHTPALAQPSPALPQMS